MGASDALELPFECRENPNGFSTGSNPSLRTFLYIVSCSVVLFFCFTHARGVIGLFPFFDVADHHQSGAVSQSSAEFSVAGYLPEPFGQVCLEDSPRVRAPQ